MPRDPSRIPAVASTATRKRNKGRNRPPTEEGIAQARGSTTIDKIHEVDCKVCGETVTLDTDMNGRLTAYDHRSWNVHRHPEAAKGETALPEPQIRKPRTISDEDIMAILEADMSAQKCADKYGQTLSWVYAVWKGSMYVQAGYDYEDGRVRRKQRALARAAKKKTRIRGDRTHAWTSPMQRLQV